MTSVAHKYQLRAAAVGLAAAMTFTPTAIASADTVSAHELPAAPAYQTIDIAPQTPGHIAMNPLPTATWWWWTGPTSPEEEEAQAQADASAAAAEAGEPRVIFDVQLINLVPRFLRPLFGWFTRNLDFGICVGGLSVRLGPYGRITGSVGSSC